MAVTGKLSWPFAVSGEVTIAIANITVHARRQRMGVPTRHHSIEIHGFSRQGDHSRGCRTRQSGGVLETDGAAL